MHLMKTFWVLLLKDFLITIRSPIWTIFELATPIALSLFLFQYEHAGRGLFRERHKMNMTMKRFTLEQCCNYNLFYINMGPDKDAIEKIIDRVPWQQKKEFRTRNYLRSNLTFAAKEKMRNYYVPTNDIGVEFEALDENGLAFHVHSLGHKPDVPAFLQPRESRLNPVFSSETFLYDLRSTHPIYSERHPYVQLCLAAAFQNKSFDNETFIEYNDVDANFYEDAKIKEVLKHLHMELPVLFGPILVSSAVTMVADKETGMKDFLLVMGLKKPILFLESFTFSLLKGLLVIAVIMARLSFVLPSYVLPVVMLSTFLLCVGIVATSMLSAAIAKTGSSAVTVSVFIFMTMVYVQHYAPTMYEPSFLQYICLLDIFVAYDKFLKGVRICYLRGVENIRSALFLYKDIVNVGTSLVFFILDIVFFMVLVLFLDYISIKPLLAFAAGAASSVDEASERSEGEGKNFSHGNYQRYGEPELSVSSEATGEQFSAEASCEQIFEFSEDDEKSWHEHNQGTEEPSLVVKSVSKIWATTGEPAVKQFSMEAYRGQVTVLLGHNGAGKSTTYAMICGLTPATKGSITVLGTHLSNSICADRPPVGFCPQSNCLFASLTVEDHLRLLFILKNGEGSWEDEADILCAQLGLSDLAKKKAGKLSGGEKRKLCVAMAFIGGSELVMLDEPTAGMDPQARIHVKRMIEEKKKSVAIVLATHYLDEVEALGDFVYILQTGRCVSSGTPYFLKARFAPDIVLTVVFAKNASKEDVDATNEIISNTIEGAEMGAMNGSQVRFKVPKDQQDRIPKLLENLENKESLHISSFGLSTKALEEAFLKIGEMKGNAVKNSSAAFIRDPALAEIHGSVKRTVQQIRYTCFKKLVYNAYNIPLIINQWIVPLTLLFLIGPHLQVELDGSELYHVPDISLRRVITGRFLIFDASNNTNRRLLLEKVLQQKYPNLQVVKWMSVNREIPWLKTYPWPVGGAVIRSEEEISKGKNPYLWLSPMYLCPRLEMLFLLISDVEFAEGNLQLNVSLTSSDIQANDEWRDDNLEVAGLIFFIASVLLNISCVTPLMEERVSNFRYQQFLAGLHPLVFWTTTFALDMCIIVTVTSLMMLVLLFFIGSINWMLMLYSFVFNFSMIPFIYVVSLVINGSGKAKCICLVYQICSAFAILAIRRDEDITTHTMLVPGASFLFAAIGVFSPQSMKKGPLSASKTCFCSLAHGVVFLAMIFIYELHLERFVLKSMSSKTYIEKSDVPDDPNVIMERDLVNKDISKFRLAVQDLTKYYGFYCAVKETTYGVRKEDCFGLLGANGAGKTSTFDIITGIRFANSGNVFIENKIVKRIQKIGYCPQFDAMLPRLSCRQNMLIIAGIIGYKKPGLIVDEMLQFLDMLEHCNKTFSNCSGGQKRRISIGTALLHPSKLAILDEPTAGIDPEARHHIWSLLDSMRIDGKAILLSSHSMEECEALCSRVAILVRGKLVAIGASQELKARYANHLFLHAILKTLKDKELVMNEVLRTFPSSSLLTKRTDSLVLKFKICKGERELVSTVYKKVQEMASKLPLEDFILLQSSLEDVLENLNKLHSGLL